MNRAKKCILQNKAHIDFYKIICKIVLIVLWKVLGQTNVHILVVSHHITSQLHKLSFFQTQTDFFLFRWRLTSDNWLHQTFCFRTKLLTDLALWQHDSSKLTNCKIHYSCAVTVIAALAFSLTFHKWSNVHNLMTFRINANDWNRRPVLINRGEF